MVWIERVTSLPDYWVRIGLGSGNVVELDMKLRFKSARFQELMQPDLFNSVRTDGNCVSWGEKVYLQLGTVEILDMLNQLRDPKERDLYLKDVAKALPSYLVDKLKHPDL